MLTRITVRHALSKSRQLWVCLRSNVLIFGTLVMLGLLHMATAQPFAAQRGQSLGGGKTLSMRVLEPATSSITFSRIDPVGDRCVMVYGSLSFGGDDFLIQDCGDPVWEKQRIISLGHIDRMFFQNETTGWFVVSGALVKVKEHEAEFNAQVARNNQDERIRDIFFINERLGWICGVGGSIYKTEDGGASWKRKESDTDIDLKEIRFLNARDGWASGREARGGKSVSVTLITKDGGDSWASLNQKKGLDLFPVFFTSSRHGCGIDDDNGIVCTQDGDKWRVVHSGEGKRTSKTSIFFLNEKKGWVAGDRIWHTEDGGETWEQQSALPTKASLIFERIVLVNENLGWAQTLDHVWRTSDGGLTWTKISDAWRARLKKIVSQKL